MVTGAHWREGWFRDLGFMSHSPLRGTMDCKRKGGFRAWSAATRNVKKRGDFLYQEIRKYWNSSEEMLK